MAGLPPAQSSIDSWNTATPNLEDLADIAQCTYMHGRPTPHQSSIEALHTAAPNLADIAQCTYTYGRPTPWSIKHRFLEYCYTKLGRSRRYSTMHIYVWQVYPPSQSSIDSWNTATPNLADVADIAQCTYMHSRPTPHQSSIDALNTATPHLAHLMANLA